MLKRPETASLSGMPEEKSDLKGRLESLLMGPERSVHDPRIFRQLSLAAFLAWVGLGSDGLSSSCYGPPEAFAALHQYPFLGLFVALATAITILVISSSYSQIIELFPSGGGGFVVASKLLSPWAGAVSGCALLVDYVLTIAISVASGTDALFSLLPGPWQPWRLHFAVAMVLALAMLNIRGVRESVVPLVPIFLAFVLCHLLAIAWAIGVHATDMGGLVQRTAQDVGAARSSLGLWGMLVLIMHSYSMGAGTYTGIEAVSNGIPVLREPKVRTARRAMTYMAISLAVTAAGLMLAYLLYGVRPDPTGHKTLNAILMEAVAEHWPRGLGGTFITITLISEATILCVAAQTGFLDGPRVLANMALDRWMPSRLSHLSDRLVTRNGVLMMGLAAVAVLLLTGKAVGVLIVLYSINVFITFALSQTGMVRHWWIVRRQTRGWGRKLGINGLGLMLTLFILTWVCVTKFHQGGWVTLLVTAALVAVAGLIRRHYRNVGKAVTGFDRVARSLAEQGLQAPAEAPGPPCDPKARTAVVLVSGFNGLGLHTALNAARYFGDCFRNFVFVCVGVVDAGNFKGSAEIDRLSEHIRGETDRYVQFMRREGYYAEGVCAVSASIIDELSRLAPDIVRRFPNSVFLAGQLVFAHESFVTRLLHNNIVFMIQRRLYREGIPFVVLPFRV